MSQCALAGLMAHAEESLISLIDGKWDSSAGVMAFTDGQPDQIWELHQGSIASSLAALFKVLEEDGLLHHDPTQILKALVQCSGFSHQGTPRTHWRNYTPRLRIPLKERLAEGSLGFCCPVTWPRCFFSEMFGLQSK